MSDGNQLAYVSFIFFIKFKECSFSGQLFNSGFD